MANCQFSTDIVAIILCHICAAAGAARGLSTISTLGLVSVRPQKEFGPPFCGVHRDQIFPQSLH